MDRQKELRQWFALAEQDLNFAKNGAATMRPIPVERI